MRVIPNTGNNMANYIQMPSTNSLNQDNILKSIQQQIENVQKQLQSLSDNEKIPIKEKMEKQKELQQQIQDLNRQMAQRKIEIQREKQEKAQEIKAPAKNQEPELKNPQPQGLNAMGTTTMQGLISADASMTQVKTFQAVKTNLKGEAHILTSEINMDKKRAGSTAAKEDQLAKLNEQAETVSKDLMTKMTDINTALEKSREETPEGEKTNSIETFNRSENEKIADETRGKPPESDRLETSLKSSAGSQVSGEQGKGQYVNLTL